MCLAYPGKVVSVEGDLARVDFGAGTIRDAVNISLVEATIGDYVLVHAGYAIQVMNQAEAEETLKYWHEALAVLTPSGD
jgi:hydrogenase expression/formation protein HypC